MYGFTRDLGIPTRDRDRPHLRRVHITRDRYNHFRFKRVFTVYPNFSYVRPHYADPDFRRGEKGLLRYSRNS